MFETKNFHPTNLVVLDFSWSKILGESIDWIKATRKLKVLDLSNCKNLRRTPDLSTLVFLEILRLRGCGQIKKLPNSIGKLQSLIELDLLGTSIDHLPDSFSNLKQLTTLRMRDIKGGLTKLPSAIWFVQSVTGPFWSNGSRQSCLKMPDLSGTQISGLPTVANLVSNIRELEIAAQESRRLGNPTWTPLGELENVIVLSCGPDRTRSQMEKQILATPNMRFLLQLPSSLRDSIFRELANSPFLYFCSTCWWMPIFVGICDSELEKLLLQDCPLSRQLYPFCRK
ncbi:disease resistance protein TAO1-like [Eucalyptus grandis]|uniref:disease resistance protein TAO1-like n=1 Tax=Eucalyptus grandis TaxID=71139 RepID=UPI00192EA2F3|nr:disease resistance protein TAO1-like [Eucalyptus grandis]